MYKCRFVTDGFLSDSERMSICKIKDLSWHYGIESQLSWMKENIIDTDLHLLLSKDDIIIGYLNLLNIRVDINGNEINALGIGNVCVSKKGTGNGATLMTEANKYLSAKGLKGMLFCNSNLTQFYKKNDWTIVPKSRTKFPNLDEVKFETMVFNVHYPIESITYIDRLF